MFLMLDGGPVINLDHILGIVINETTDESGSTRYIINAVSKDHNNFVIIDTENLEQARSKWSEITSKLSDIQKSR